MAQVFKFRRGSTDTNLLDGAGWYVGPDWVPTIADVEEGVLPAPVDEVFTIQSNYSNHDNLAAALVSLNKLRHDARRYIKDSVEPNAVWLHDSLTGETGERRALVRRISIEALAEQRGPGGQGSMIDARPHYRLGVEREGLWEAVEPTTPVLVWGRESLGGEFDYTSSPGAVVGSAPARLNRLLIVADTTGVTFPFLWIGFRSFNRHGTLANFVGIWELERGTSQLGDTAAAADSTASGVNKVLCQFSTSATWAERWTIDAWQAVGANYADNTGSFLLLARAKVDSGTVAEMQFRHGYAGEADADLKAGPIVEVSGTSWTEHEMGTLRIPLRGRQGLSVAISDDQTQRISIWARRTSGSGSLHLDCVNLIPIDEYFISCSRAAIYNGGGSSLPRWAFEVTPQNQPFAFTWDAIAGGVRTISPINVEGAGVPVGHGRMYVVMARASKVTDIDDRYSANFNCYPRWYDLRGAE